MKILKIEIIKLDVTDRGDWILIQVHTDEGVSGLGEASQSGNDYLLMKVLKWLEVQLRGEDPLQIEVLWEKMVYELGVYSGDHVIATAISAVDQALWDIKGKVLGVPVWQLLGGSHREKVRVYANVNRGLRDRSAEGLRPGNEQVRISNGRIEFRIQGSESRIQGQRKRVERSIININCDFNLKHQTSNIKRQTSIFFLQPSAFRHYDLIDPHQLIRIHWSFRAVSELPADLSLTSRVEDRQAQFSLHLA